MISIAEILSSLERLAPGRLSPSLIGNRLDGIQSTGNIAKLLLQNPMTKNGARQTGSISHFLAIWMSGKVSESTGHGVAHDGYLSALRKTMTSGGVLRRQGSIGFQLDAVAL